MKKVCELCKSPARIYCESDEASLCWDCDSKVHGANFLVARHERTLLCRACRSPTPWSASGADLNPTTVSLCLNCVGVGGPVAGAARLVMEVKVGVPCEENSRGGGEVREEMDARGELVSLDRDGDGEEESEEDDDDDDDDEDDGEEDASYSEVEDEDNQVVPWSGSSPPPPLQLPPPPPSTTSSSSSDGNDDDDDYYSTTIQRRNADDESPMSVPLKRQRQIPSDPQSQEDPDERSTPRTRGGGGGGGVGAPVTGASLEDHSGVDCGGGRVVLRRNRGGTEPLAVDGVVGVVRDRTTGSSSIVEPPSSSSSSGSGRLKRGVDFGLNASTTRVAAELSKRPRSS